MNKPTGHLRIETIIPGPPSKLAARGTVVVRDETGLQWCFPATYFAYDLKPYARTQALDFTQWKDAVTEGLLPHYNTCPETARFDFEGTYRAGHAPEAAIQAIIELVHFSWGTQEEGTST